MRFPDWIKGKQSTFFAPGYCAIGLLPHEIVIVYLLKNKNEMNLQFCKSFPYEELTALKSTLIQAVKENQLQSIASTWVLTRNHYQVIYTEPLPVTAAEFQQAIRWKIQDSVPYPIQDAIIDHFDMPEQKTGSSSNKMMAVVVARKSYVDAFSQILKEAGLRLTTVDIPELALRNLTALYENDEKATALIYLQNKDSEIMITQQKTLYFSRKLEFGLEHYHPDLMTEADLTGQLDKLSLEIQRSFDYYQAQWRNPTPTRIFLAMAEGSPENIAKQLEKRLSIPLHVFNISEIIPCKTPISVEQQGKYLPVFGAVIRDVITEYEATS